MNRRHFTVAAGTAPLVTHQVNVLALTGDNLAMGGAVVVQPDRRGGVRSVGRIDPGG
jgi:hypothetical protein